MWLVQAITFIPFVKKTAMRTLKGLYVVVENAAKQELNRAIHTG
jgi:hypothetical protein